jgi:hypothetical protein
MILIGCQSSILKIFWPNIISNKDLLNRCQQEDMATIITKRWKWIGHVLIKEPDDTTKIACTGHQREKERVRPKVTWQRTVEAEIKHMKESWNSLQKTARDRHRWRALVAALHAKGIMGSK